MHFLETLVKQFFFLLSFIVQFVGLITQYSLPVYTILVMFTVVNLLTEQQKVINILYIFVKRINN